MSAHLHLLVPTLSHLALTDGSIDKPAKLSTLKLPRRTTSPDLGGALLYHPTGGVVLILGSVHGQKKEHLSFNVYGNVPPSLLKALYGLERSAH